MGITKIRGLFVVGFTSVLLAGCASNEPDDGPGMDPGTQAPAPMVEPQPKPEPTPERIRPMVDRGKIVIPVDEMGSATETLVGVFHFDFDQAIVKRGGHVELNKHAQVLSGDSMLRVRLEGHADERGTREYNLALGEHRGNAVRAYLVAQGALRSQVEVVSYGEEKPVNSSHNESAWAQNRRVEIVYR